MNTSATPGCTNPQYTTQSSCEAAGVCDDATITNQTACEVAGVCSDNTITNQTDCEDASQSNSWTPHQWTPYLWYTGTLDIYMTNSAGCSYCSNSDYNNNTIDWLVKKENCEVQGDTTWVSYENITEEACAAIPGFQAQTGG